MNKLCIFNKDKSCSECGDCYTCDINPNKKCSNCGKCLELEGYDIKAIEIDDILESNSEFGEFEELSKMHDDALKLLCEDEEVWDYIDDIRELKDLIEDENKLNEYEEFPGLIVYKKNKNI